MCAGASSSADAPGVIAEGCAAQNPYFKVFFVLLSILHVEGEGNTMSRGRAKVRPEFVFAGAWAACPQDWLSPTRLGNISVLKASRCPPAFALFDLGNPQRWVLLLALQQWSSEQLLQ